MIEITGLKMSRAGILVYLFLLISTSLVQSQDSTESFRIVFGCNVSGSIETLAKRATASERLNDSDSIMLSFGGLLGDTRIVAHEKGLYFLRNAKNAGIDYIIPSAKEFMFGKDHLLEMQNEEDIPAIISANIVDERTHESLFQPYICISSFERKICIIPLSDQDTIRNTDDEHIAGIDVLPTEEALQILNERIMSEQPDYIILAGRLSHGDIINTIDMYPQIDLYLTNNQSAGFINELSTTHALSINEKQVYISPDSDSRLGVITITGSGLSPSITFADLVLDSSFPPQTDMFNDMNETLQVLQEYDREEAHIKHAGKTLADTLAQIFEADAVFFERDALFHYHVGDTLFAADVPKLVRPGVTLERYSLSGELIQTIWNRIRESDDDETLIHFGGMTVDAKIDSIPLQDSRMYQVLTTPILHQGEHGFDEFTRGGPTTLSDVDIKESLELYLEYQEEQLRKALRPKFWQLDLFLTLNTNYEYTDVNTYKQSYGNRVPKPFRSMNDSYTGVFLLSSQNNLLTYSRTIGKHHIEHELKASYSREGKRKSSSDHIEYTDQRNHDPIEQYTKYTYKVDGFPIEPYIDMRFVSVLYSGAGKHPLTATVSTGATKTFPKLLGLNLSIGLQGTRDYVIPENDFGTKSTISFNHTFPAKSLLTTETMFRSRTNIFWTPMARYHMECKVDSDTSINIQVWKRINAQFTVRAYSYRNSLFKKVAIGLYYNFTLNYGMTWNF